MLGSWLDEGWQLTTECQARGESLVVCRPGSLLCRDVPLLRWFHSENQPKNRTGKEGWSKNKLVRLYGDWSRQTLDWHFNTLYYSNIFQQYGSLIHRSGISFSILRSGFGVIESCTLQACRVLRRRSSLTSHGWYRWHSQPASPGCNVAWVIHRISTWSICSSWLSMSGISWPSKKRSLEASNSC